MKILLVLILTFLLSCCACHQHICAHKKKVNHKHTTEEMVDPIAPTANEYARIIAKRHRHAE